MKVAAKPCKHRGCPHYIRDGLHHVDCKTPDVDLAKAGKRQAASSKMYDDRRGSSAKRGYGGKWQRQRAQYLKDNPLCKFCEVLGFVTAADVIDHVRPHKGNERLFRSYSNWQSLCFHHHNSDKQRIEAKWFKGLVPDEALKGIGVKLSTPI